MLLILDEKPRHPLKRLQVETKFFLREGLRHWNWHQVFRSSKLGGHRTRSFELLRELRRRKVEFVHNDFSMKTNYQHALVTNDPLALRWAIEQKRDGKIKTLVAGPQIVNLPSEAGNLLSAPEIDAVLFGSPWVRDLFKTLSPDRFAKSYIWPAGVDEREWQPGLGKKDLVLVLDKNSGLLDPVVSKLLQKNYKLEVLRNGKFTRRAYRDLLHKARFGVFLSHSEGQGISMFESWSCNVPTIHWNPKSMKYFGKNYSPASSCFYLTDQCGMDFSDIEDFSSTVDKFEWRYRSFSPRNFVLAGYTLKDSVDRFIDILSLPQTEKTLPGLDRKPYHDPSMMQSKGPSLWRPHVPDPGDF